MSAKADIRALLAVLALSLAATGPTFAQDNAGPTLSLELNALQPTEGGCRLTFVVQNGLSTLLEKAAFEVALFDGNGQVNRLTILDFKDLPAGKTKVRRFDLNGSKCEEIGRVLINDATECAGPGVDPKTCIRQLKTGSKAGVTFGS